MVAKTDKTPGKSPFDKLFGGIVLPVKPALAATGAAVALIEEVPAAASEEAFFGGYAEGMLADIGMEAVDEQPRGEVRARRV